jgi:Zn-finger nucleic acid-binding protein
MNTPYRKPLAAPGVAPSFYLTPLRAKPRIHRRGTWKNAVKCPVDKTGMVIIEHQGIELDYCTHCRGVWFDAGELELLLELGGLPDAAPFLRTVKERAEAVTAEKPRACPLCGRKMKKSAVDEDSGVIVDICRDDHGIWFDHREVEQLAEALARRTPEGREASRMVLDYLHDIFQY